LSFVPSEESNDGHTNVEAKLEEDTNPPRPAEKDDTELIDLLHGSSELTGKDTNTAGQFAPAQHMAAVPALTLHDEDTEGTDTAAWKWAALLELYIFGNQYDIAKLHHTIMNACIEKANTATQPVPLKIVRRAFSQLPSDSPMRWLILDIWAYKGIVETTDRYLLLPPEVLVRGVASAVVSSTFSYVPQVSRMCQRGSTRIQRRGGSGDGMHERERHFRITRSTPVVTITTAVIRSARSVV